ncbi:hypothetical protein SAMN04487905_10643 [Actinopolyspora xinjiangensis]|uniref:Uncharacterized protein n=1 Tax=Actinopolyspora xinjiangensis TaxID=405564 RepID=A0A1H0U4F8_9ACTN|nr:hypothetical protein SAMN04487905_10643 [Actinopolyspora xinjiangensis]
MSRPRGQCPHCRRPISITTTGRVRHHAGGVDTHYPGEGRTYRCPGAGQAPADIDAALTRGQPD